LKIILTSILLTFSLSVLAQSRFYKFSIGGGAGFTKSYADLHEHNYGEAIYGTADFFFTPFLSLGVEAQNGTVKGGQSNQDPSGLRFTNSYRSATLNGKVFLGTFINYQRSSFLEQIKGLYVGAGVGLLQNRVFDLKRNDRNEPDRVYQPFTNEAIIPMSLGFNYYRPNRYGHYRYVVNLNYQSNITLGEGLDGYDSSTIRYKNGNPDVYTYLTLGLKYNFGPIGLSKKTFKRY
jgi:hypothetical protein